MSTPLRDLINIPERVYKGDFVLKLGEGVSEDHAQQTLDAYVVTPQLAKSFDEALGLIQAAVEAHSSKAAYLHGSFGAGKSHFMAVLHLLLRNDPRARSLPGLAEVVGRHDEWLEGKRFLLPTYHLLGARSLEDAVLGGYVNLITRLHPNAPVPAVYASSAVFGTIAQFREDLGEEKFFSRLNAHTGKDEGWGDLGAGWSFETYEQAAAAPPTDADHQRLVSDIVAAFLPAHGTLFHTQGGFVDIDAGLAIVSQHAKSLGYDAVVLFLDKLILWLMTQLADQAFVSKEATKVSKLVEAAAADRPAPLVSFVARQRDLRELVGGDIPGAERLSLLDALKWWEGRFATITLEDRNLPAIAERRVLAPRSDVAKRSIDEAFERLRTAMPSHVNDILLGEDGDAARFRQTYPFSPAFVETLVAASSALQRERTALKVMAQVLSDRRDDLTVDEVIPVGDLYDALDASDEPFSAEMAQQFEAARRLYDTRLRPLLLELHGVADAVADDNVAFRADDRLVKTLLLAALVPTVGALQGLDAAHLVALNWGQIKGLFAGQEASTVVQKLRTWASRIGELKLSDDSTNPTVAIQLTGIDLEAILDRARHNDTDGERRKLLRELLLAEFGIDSRAMDTFTLTRQFTWRGSRRTVELAFANVRDRDRLPDASLRPTGGDPKIVLDLPFDDETYGPSDDRARVQEFLQTNEPAETICWLPNFFSREVQNDLGTLVVLEYVLTGERLAGLTDHLPPGQRPAARQLLENQRDALRQRITLALAQSYGVTTIRDGLVTVELEPAEQFQALDPMIQPHPPVGPTLVQGLDGISDQLMAHRYPAHPAFESEVKDAPLQTVLAESLRAVDAEADNHRVEVERPKRNAMLAIAGPLGLGTQHEVAFVLGHRWKQHFDQQHAVGGGGRLSVKSLREYIDRPKPMGLDRKVQDLLILVYAAQSKRSFWAGDAPFTQGRIGNLPDEAELREQKLPDEKTWQEACSRAASVFGLAPSPLRTATEVARLTQDLRDHQLELREPAQRLVAQLNACLDRIGLASDESNRWKSANRGVELLAAIKSAPDEEVVERLADATLEPSAQSVGTTLKRSSEVALALETAPWTVIEGVQQLAGSHPEAAAINDRTLELLKHDEHAQALSPALRQLIDDAARFLAGLTPPPPPPPPPPSGYTRIESDRKIHLLPNEAATELDRIRTLLDQDSAHRLTLDWTVEREDDA
ncbi:MAG: hypothetical protein MSC30_04130 [Gaiellaceae bacterium MAG52_C11]|nr:hypothetical protein [Candidatus Gaiellasilicea maunaloa]